MAQEKTIVYTLRNILSQESTAGFTDTTVIGGLDKFISANSRQLAGYMGKMEIHYSSLTIEDRKIWVSKILSILPIETDSKSVRGEMSSGKYGKRQTYRKRTLQGIRLSNRVRSLKDFGPKSFKDLMAAKFSVATVGDLVMHFPSHHEDFTDLRKITDLTVGQTQSSVLTVRNMNHLSSRQRRSRNEVTLYDETGTITVTFFNQPWVNRVFKKGVQVLVSGQVGIYRGKITFKSPSYEVLADDNSVNIHTGRFVPVYPLTEGIRQKTMRRVVALALASTVDQVREYLPEDILRRTGLMGRGEAIARYHYPRDRKNLTDAKRRLAFDEFFLISLVAEKRRLEWRSQVEASGIKTNIAEIDLINTLPFQLTKSQVQAVMAILGDLSETKAMRRMLQGDVGSGKTAVATLAMLAVSSEAHQSALMAPTEVLAEQHFASIARLLNPNIGTHVLGEDGNTIEIYVESINKNVKVALLIGSFKESIKARTKNLLKAGDIDIVVGTHALIQETVEIPRLALAIVDEQHRFGVLQRSILHDKNPRPHLLVMSATPIPRSLWLTMCGDLDITVLDELPAGRKAIQTLIESPDRRENVYRFIKKQIADGRQAFFVFPLIDDSKSINARSAVSEFDRLANGVFSGLSLGLLHGRMTLQEKEEVMERFRSRKVDILVATAVIEVGVDVPNASVMVIDGADRFGLSQMHQIRGRVGRGDHQSYCILISENPSQDAIQRMEILHRVSDGFVLAEEDMKIRGTGDYLGTRQSGQAIFQVANMSDRDLLSLARIEAHKVVEIDPDLTSSKNANIRQKYALQLEELAVQIN